MSSPIDAEFGKVSKIPYSLSISYESGLILANGELTLKSLPTFSPKGMVQIEREVRYYVDDTELDIYPHVEGLTASSTKVELNLRRTIPRYYIALLSEDGKPWYEWSAEANPYDDIFFDGRFATLSGTVGGWGYAVLSLTLTSWPFSAKSGPAVIGNP